MPSNTSGRQRRRHRIPRRSELGEQRNSELGSVDLGSNATRCSGASQFGNPRLGSNVRQSSKAV
eukprot:6643607-Alexandrium_andersonii.AAC.1